MVDTLTPNIQCTIQTDGGNSTTWGDIANANFSRIDAVIGATTTVSTTGGTTTLTVTQEEVGIISVSGTLVSAATIAFSGRGGRWIIQNTTTGAFTLTCKVTGQTGVAIPQGTQQLVFCNGTDIFLGQTQAAAASEITVASASTTDILSVASSFIAISGTATITSLGSAPNTLRYVRATGAFTLTYNASTLILPGAQNITAAAGDTFIVISDVNGNARIYDYVRTSGQPVTSSIPIGTIEDYAFSTVPDSRWLFLNGQTIGNANSGGTGRASNSPDTQTTFIGLWNSYSNSVLPIQDSSGTPTTRGASGAADFSANRRMPLPDVRGRSTVAADNMGGSSAGIMTAAHGFDGTILGNTGGEQVHTLLTAELASHNHGITDPGHTHTYTASNNNNQNSGTVNACNSGVVGSTTGSSTTGITINNTGSGTAHNTVHPAIICNMIMYCGVP
jgi:microcystin-dependent protein